LKSCWPIRPKWGSTPWNASPAGRRSRRECAAADKLNNADSVCYQAEKTLADFGEKLGADLKNKVEAALRETREALGRKDPEQAAQRAERLGAVLQEVGKTLYAGAARPTPQPEVHPPTGEARPSGAGPHGRVVDAEFKEQHRSQPFHSP
jgi:molecular chaperone DnaK